MKTRLLQWYEEMTAIMTESELISNMLNGDIKPPEWLTYRMSAEFGFTIYDKYVLEECIELVDLDYSERNI